ncbi:MAG: hypothetical protein HXX10_07525 [Rhodoplanes sp.]|uniref:hypothetical protein n=1 Tax=Rhodoplanes sp. TaxID=1968906 RepID=UPI0017D006DA|nr:hypothetical protein [Rhodoplanes sp.]NVO13870.1 hypothetical protein [Rhodoplanes sp.]
MTTVELSNKAYYAGRNSIGDEGEVWYGLVDCPEFAAPELAAEFKSGVNSIKSELRLNADPEWN